MNKELIQAAAVITAEILRRPPTNNMEATEDVIASAFETAYRGLEAGIERLRKTPAPTPVASRGVGQRPRKTAPLVKKLA